MLLAALVLSLAVAPASPAPPPAPQATRQADCLRSCAGAPKDASGQKLMACLQRCEAPAPASAPDAGVP